MGLHTHLPVLLVACSQNSIRLVKRGDDKMANRFSTPCYSRGDSLFEEQMQESNLLVKCTAHRSIRHLIFLSALTVSARDQT
jgi:hypothetical protein